MKLLLNALIFFIKIIFPQCCLICGKNCNDIWCEECKNWINLNILLRIDTNFNDKLYFDKKIHIFQYKDKIRNLILDYKFKDKSYLYKIFAEIIIKNKKICRILKSYDIIIPVPIHKKRKNERGYNQSELIAKKIALGIENLTFENRIIKKRINNKKQSMLNREERRRNVENAYELINNEKIINKKIILFDDIYTTGCTVNEIAKLLKNNGAKEVLVLTIAKD